MVNYDAVYAGSTPLGSRAPWDIGKAQPVLVELEDAGVLRGDVLDAGCGSGENALFLARLGYRVIGMDISRVAVKKAREKAAAEGLAVAFEVGDALALDSYEEQFDTVLDCGLFDVCPPDRQVRYARGVHRACRPGALLVMLELSAEATTYMKGRFAALGVPISSLRDLPHLEAADLRSAFAEGWREEWLKESTMCVWVPGTDEQFTVPALYAGFRRV